MCYRLPSVGAIWAHGVPCMKKYPKTRPATAFVGKEHIHAYDSKGNIFCSDGVMIVKGLENFIVASVGGVVLICPKDDEQSVKQMVADAKAKG